MGINLLAFLMQELSKHDEQFKPIFGTLMLMAEAGDEDSSINFSAYDIGITATSNKIEIVNIETNEAIAVLELKLFGQPVKEND